MAKLLDHIWPSCWTRHGQAAGPNMAKLVDQIRPSGCRPDMAKRLDQIWPSGCRPDMAKRLDQIWPSCQTIYGQAGGPDTAKRLQTRYGQAARPDKAKRLDQIWPSSQTRYGQDGGPNWLKFAEGKNTWVPAGGDIVENLFGKFMKFYGQCRALKPD